MIKISALIKTISFSFIYVLAFAFNAFAADSCPTLNEYMNDGIGDNFILKEAYEIIAGAASNVASFSWNNFAKPLQAVVGLGAAIYIAVYTLKNIASFSQQDTAAYLSNEKTGVIPLAVKMMVVVWLLGNQTFIYEYIIGLAVTTCVEIGTLIGSNSGVKSFSSPDNLADLFQFVIQQVIDFNNSIYKIVATGQLLLCMALSPESITDYYWKTIPFGAALWIYGWMIIIGVSFYMLDVLFRLGVGCIVLPFAIACGMSKLTSDYTRKTWNLFVNVGFNFIMLGIVISFTYDMIQQCVGLDIPENKELNEADIKLINDHLDLGIFVITGLCCMISYQLFMQIEQIVQKVSDAAPVGKVGKEVGAKVAPAAIRTATKPLRELGNVAKAGGQVAGKEIKDKTMRGMNNFSNAIKGTRMYQSVSGSWAGRAYRATKKALRWDER